MVHHIFIRLEEKTRQKPIKDFMKEFLEDKNAKIKVCFYGTRTKSVSSMSTEDWNLVFSKFVEAYKNQSLFKFAEVGLDGNEVKGAFFAELENAAEAQLLASPLNAALGQDEMVRRQHIHFCIL